MKNCAIGLKKFQEIKKERLKTHFPTKFNFLGNHNGARKAELSTVLSPNGSGKSTLVRSVTAELLSASKKTYIYLSEETMENYALNLYQYFLVVSAGNDKLADSAMKNLFIESAFEGKKFRKTLELISSIREAICTELIDFVIIDNFTASFMGNSSIKEQGDAILELKGLAIEFDIPIWLVVHTTKNFDVYSNIMTADNVRGNATTANVGSYNYCMSTFWRGKKPRSIVSVDKARYHGESQKRFYELSYDNKYDLFTKDNEITQKEFIEAQIETCEYKEKPKRANV